MTELSEDEFMYWINVDRGNIPHGYVSQYDRQPYGFNDIENTATKGKYLGIPPPTDIISSLPPFNHDKFPGFKEVISDKAPNGSQPARPQYLIPAILAGAILLIYLSQ